MLIVSIRSPEDFSTCLPDSEHWVASGIREGLKTGMTRAKMWPAEAAGHRQRALKAVRRLIRLGDEMARDMRSERKIQNRSSIFQMRRWNKAIQ